MHGTALRLGQEPAAPLLPRFLHKVGKKRTNKVRAEGLVDAMLVRALRSLAAALFAAVFVFHVASAGAEPKQPSEEENVDEIFAKSFIGRTYDGDLDIEGWTDLGGGLVSPPIYVRQYRREDGTYLVLTSREIAKATSGAPASLAVADALIVKAPGGGAEFTISCVQGKDEMLRFMGVAKGPDSKEWWSDVRRAWEISIETGAISTVKPKGVRCTNVSWGQ